MRDLKGKVALVSGAGQGIGARTAEVLAEAGAIVVVTGRTDAPCMAVVERIRAAGHQAHFRHLDVTHEEDWKMVMDDVCAKFGGLDVLVNNAGIEMVKALADLTLEDWHSVCRVNLDGVFLGTQYGVRAMTEASPRHPRADRSSMCRWSAGLVGTQFMSAYNMTKRGTAL